MAVIGSKPPEAKSFFEPCTLPSIKYDIIGISVHASAKCARNQRLRAADGGFFAPCKPE